MFFEPFVKLTPVHCLLDVASARSGRASTFSQQCHFDGCQRCFLTDIVTARRFTSRQCLAHVLDGEDAHSNRDTGRDLDLHDPLRTTLGHEFIVRCLTANHDTQHHDCVDPARLDESPSDEWQLEGARCRGDVRGGTGCTNRAVRTRSQPIDDLVVPARTDDGDNKVGGNEIRRGRRAEIRRGHVRNLPRLARRSPIDDPFARAWCADSRCCRGSASTPAAPVRQSPDRSLRDRRTLPDYW